MRFCKYCGQQISDEAKFCKYCGKQFPEFKTENPAQNAVTEETAPKTNETAETIRTAAPQAAPKAAPLKAAAPQAAPRPAVSRPAAAAPVRKEPVSTQPAAPKKPFPTKIVLMIAAIAVVLVLLICLLSSMGKTVNLNKYVVLETTGANGYGRASVSIDWDQFKADYGSKLKWKKGSGQEYGSQLVNQFLGSSLANGLASEFVQGCVFVSLDRYDDLSNNDKVSLVWDVNQAQLEQALNLKFRYKDESLTITGLEDAKTYDVFDDLTVQFSGMDSDGYIDWTVTTSVLDRYSFSADKTSGLKNGDIVTITFDENAVERYMELTGSVPVTTEKQYTVSGLGEYLMHLSDLDQASLQKMQDQASDVFYARMAQNWDSSTSLMEMSYAGAYLQTAKNPSSVSRVNSLYLIYQIQVRNQHEADDYDELTFYYWPLVYNNLMLVDGHAEADLTNYNTANNSFTVESSSNWGRKSWRFDGYEAIEDLFRDEIAVDLADYSYEEELIDSVIAASEAAKEAEESRKEEEASKYILPNSSKEAIKESDLDKLSAFEVMIARNEIYARHGRKFQDEEIREYFENCDWYHGTIDAANFNDNMLSEIERANAKLIAAYEKKKGYA